MKLLIDLENIIMPDEAPGLIADGAWCASMVYDTRDGKASIHLGQYVNDGREECLDDGGEASTDYVIMGYVKTTEVQE